MNIREWALPVYTILTQLAVGTLFVLWVIRTMGAIHFEREELDRIHKIPILIILVTVLAGITGAHFHLSKPYLSFLAVLNFHSSWLSREIAFNLLFIITVVCLCSLLWFGDGHHRLINTMGWVGILFGFATDYCMSRIYLLPSQPSWNSPLTSISFFGTTLLLGVMAVPVLLIMDSNFSKSQQKETQGIRHQVIQRSFKWLAVLSVLLVIAISAVNYFQTVALRSGNPSAQTSGLLLNLYQPLLIIRYAMLYIGVGWLVGALLLSQRNKNEPEELMTPVFMACLLVLIAEILGRFLFFAIHVRIGI
jgi:anaerobic dimethyl sulfoxide reductase subunit C (anchor subunit)